ncbi:MAG: cardiolipin synthase [Byssovorax sp.]
MTAAAPHVSIVLGIVVEIVALALIPLVVLRRKEPSSTAAWILALVFLPGLGATLFLLFGRDRVRLPVRWKRDADQALAQRRRHPHRHASPAHRDALARIPTVVDRELFRISSALPGGEPSVGNAAHLLVDGAATYAAIGAAIDAATRQVHAEYYLIARGEVADWLAERLVAAVARGVAVRLLLDGFGSFWIGRRWVRALRAAGVEVAFFLPARLIFFQPMNLRNHRKIVIVDGETAFTGGINVMDEYRRVEGQAPWRDTHLRVCGPAAQALAHVFELDWHFATRREIPHDSAALAAPSAPAPSEIADATVAIVRSGPDVEGPLRETIHRLFFSAITLARSRVYITTPYFIPDRAILVALQTAAMRGVDVRLLFPKRNNHPFVAQAGRSFYEDLLWAGVAIHEYGPGMIHAKTMVVDGTVAMVGSANMDLRSFRLNFEVHALVHDAATAAQLEACFQADLAVSSPIDPVSFAARPWTQKVIEGAARLLSPLM